MANEEDYRKALNKRSVFKKSTSLLSGRNQSSRYFKTEKAGINEYSGDYFIGKSRKQSFQTPSDNQSLFEGS